MNSDEHRWITESQRRFVLDNGAVLDRRGWAENYQDNLFVPLHPESLNDFVACSEVSDDGRGKRICAPHSSTALAVNTFDWWRGRSLNAIRHALGVDIERFVGFEQPHDFGLGRPSQPDVEFTASDGSAVAIEVKLREPYGSVTNPFADKYFETEGLWSGLPNLRELAELIRFDDETNFTTLHAAQLIKHALGLRQSYGDDFTLVYYWQYLPSEIGEQHKAELLTFDAVARNDFTFTAITVDHLMESFVTDRESMAWFEYMTKRYVMSGHSQL
ncbi:MAG: hypothetical protein WEF28_09720 [Acidimicrobiia bacterium]